MPDRPSSNPAAPSPSSNPAPSPSSASSASVRAYYAGLAGPLVAATGIVLDLHGRVLVLTTSYKDGLELPGGTVEDTETPEEGLARELKEELDLSVPVGRLLAVDSCPPGSLGRSLVVHVHLVGPLDPARIAGISFADGEITEAHWLTPEEAAERLPDRIAPGCAPPWPRCARVPWPTWSAASPSPVPPPASTRPPAPPWNTRAATTRPTTARPGPRPSPPPTCCSPIGPERSCSCSRATANRAAGCCPGAVWTATSARPPGRGRARGPRGDRPGTGSGPPPRRQLVPPARLPGADPLPLRRRGPRPGHPRPDPPAAVRAAAVAHGAPRRTARPGQAAAAPSDQGLPEGQGPGRGPARTPRGAPDRTEGAEAAEGAQAAEGAEGPRHITLSRNIAQPNTTSFDYSAKQLPGHCRI